MLSELNSKMKQIKSDGQSLAETGPRELIVQRILEDIDSAAEKQRKVVFLKNLVNFHTKIIFFRSSHPLPTKKKVWRKFCPCTQRTSGKNWSWMNF